ncbi:MAG TPA: hypothetical protein VD835_11465 [Pyrinomonadaceae bacterium]|nr:hypothetical protein [Pyrinomonadaceae bacterium]
MTARWQISAGEITEWLPPLLYAFAILASGWVLHDARHRRFPLYAIAAWTLGTLVYAPVVFPLYLVARAFRPHSAANDYAPQANVREKTEAADVVETKASGSEETGAAGGVATCGDVSEDTGERAATQSPPTAIRPHLRLTRYAPSLLYSFALLLAGAVYFYRDYHSFDAHLARAANARLLNRRDAAIREYRAALRLSDDAHTRKLLALQLAEDGQAEAALAEFRAAEQGGEPDELLPYRVASALDTLGRAAEAADEYQKFLHGSLCARSLPDARCADAATRLEQIQNGGGAR